MQVKTQQELNDALAAKELWIELIGNGYFDLSNTGNSTVNAWGNSTVNAWGNSTVTARENSTVTARENSTVNARENSTVNARENSTVTARGNSTVNARENSTVTARENSTVNAWGNSTVNASSWVVVHKLGPYVKVQGGVIIEPPLLSTPELWCEFYGVDVVDGVATVFKGVNDMYRTGKPYNFSYAIGTTPEAPDWDGGNQECGKGLHFSPHPQMTLEFKPDATKFVACPVRLSDMSVHPNGLYPQKCKAKGLCAPCYEVDRNGKRIEKVG